MSMLAGVTRGKVRRPHCILVYGIDGVGKSSFAAEAPNPIFLGPEKGTDFLDVARFPSPKKWTDTEVALKELANEKHDYQTLVVDTLDWMEPLLHKHICDTYKVKSIELAAGGYGKGYIEAVNEWLKFKEGLEEIRDKKGMNIVLLGHCDITNFQDPNNQIAYNRYELKLHKKASALFREYVDAVLFATYEVFSKKEGSQLSVFSEGDRVLFTERRPGFDAKNRFGLPLKIDLGWSSLVDAIERGQPDSADAIRNRILGMMTLITDQELLLKVTDTLEKAGQNIMLLNAIAKRLATLIADAEGAK